MNLTIEVIDEGNHFTVKLIGEIDVYTASKLKTRLIPLTEKEGSTVKIDLKQTSYLDSTGLGVFINAYKSAKKNKSNLEIIHVRDRVLRLFKVTGLHEIMDVQVDE